MPPVAAAIGMGIAAISTVSAVAATAVVMEVGTGILIGAAVGAAGAAITGGDIGKGALLGGITGGVMSGVSVAVNGVSSWAANSANNALGITAGSEGAAVAGQTGALLGSSPATGTAGTATTTGVTQATDAAGATAGAEVSTEAATAKAAGGAAKESGGYFGFLSKENPTLLDYGKMQMVGEGVKGAATAALSPDPADAIKAQTEGQIAVQAANNAAQQITLGGVDDKLASATAKFTDTPLWRQIAESPDWRQPLLKKEA